MLFVALAALAGGNAGCSSGPAVQHLSGKVTFNQQPVPAGRVFFLPDPTKANTGPGGFAEIKDGVFNTRTQGAAP
jgi:hypothetical protein